MNSLKALYFPATDLYSIRQYPIFLLSQNIHMIQPVEDKADQTSKESTDSFINSGFCQVDTPCPLGKNRDRFLHLVEDIRNRKDDYAAQLSALTIAAMTAQTDKSENSERAIINEMLTPADLASKKDDQEQEGQLWQARLLLAIGEILDAEEEEIAANLASLDDDTAGLFKNLQGEADEIDDSLFNELTQIEQKLGGSNRKTMQKRLVAWKTLFGECRLVDSDLFITTSQDATDYLIHSFEKQSDTTPTILSGLSVPGILATQGVVAYNMINNYVDENRDTLEATQQYLKYLSQLDFNSAKEPKIIEEFSEISRKWNESLEKTFPTKELGRIDAKIHIFPNRSCPSLLDVKKTTGGPRNGMVITVE